MNRLTLIEGRTSVRQTGCEPPPAVGMNPDPHHRFPQAWPLFAAWVILLTSPATHAAELGRLFFTPQERKQLEIQGAVKSDGPVQRDTLTVNGMLQKNGGQRIVWINGKPQTQPVSPGKSPTSVQIAVPESVTPIEVKVGQRIELNPAQTISGE